MTLPHTAPVRRRSLLGAGAALGIASPIAAALAAPTPAAAASPAPLSARRRSCLGSALGFLAGVTDAYRTSGPRLAQSYQDDSGLTDIAFVYDNALTCLALLAGGDVRRARAIGDALLFAQANDERLTDRRLRQAYHADTFVTTVDGRRTAHFGWEFSLSGTAVGDMAWAGLALLQLARYTKAKSYLDGTVAIGRWIHQNTYSTSGLGGYTFGETEGLEEHKSAEHNVDLYGYFRLLAELTGDAVWRTRADHAWRFVEQMWNDEAGFLYTGSDDGAAVNTAAAQRPLDVQTWAWLVARNATYGRGLDWAKTNLATVDTPVRTNSALTGNRAVFGVAFSTGSLLTDTGTTIGGYDDTPKPDSAAVWLEGTAQLALALRDRGRGSDTSAADDLLDQLCTLQGVLGRGQTFGGRALTGGLVAASSPMDTGYTFGYYPNLHVGATSWFVFALTATNPFRGF